LAYEFASQSDKARGVHIEKARCRSACWREADDRACVDREVVTPTVAPRIVQVRLFFRFWINAD
jgi:hypothetical protein